MPVSKQRKIIATIMCLSAAALVIDRAFLGSSLSGPHGADAAPAELSGATDASSRPARAQRAETGASAYTWLAARLAAIRPGGSAPAAVADAFAPPPGWAPVAVASTQAPKPQAPSPLAGKRLGAIMNAPNGRRMVLIDGQVMHEGDVYLDMTLLSIGDVSATFSGAGHTTEIFLPGKAPGDNEPAVRRPRPPAP